MKMTITGIKMVITHTGIKITGIEAKEILKELNLTGISYLNTVRTTIMNILLELQPCWRRLLFVNKYGEMVKNGKEMYISGEARQGGNGLAGTLDDLVTT